jgi:hypothetical protein
MRTLKGQSVPDFDRKDIHLGKNVDYIFCKCFRVELCIKERNGSNRDSYLWNRISQKIVNTLIAGSSNRKSEGELLTTWILDFGDRLPWFKP